MAPLKALSKSLEAPRSEIEVIYTLNVRLSSCTHFRQAACSYSEDLKTFVNNVYSVTPAR